MKRGERSLFFPVLSFMLKILFFPVLSFMLHDFRRGLRSRRGAPCKLQGKLERNSLRGPELILKGFEKDHFDFNQG